MYQMISTFKMAKVARYALVALLLSLMSSSAVSAPVTDAEAQSAEVAEAFFALVTNANANSVSVVQETLKLDDSQAKITRDTVRGIAVFASLRSHLAGLKSAHSISVDRYKSSRGGQIRITVNFSDSACLAPHPFSKVFGPYQIQPQVTWGADLYFSPDKAFYEAATPVHWRFSTVRNKANCLTGLQLLLGDLNPAH